MIEGDGTGVPEGDGEGEMRARPDANDCFIGLVKEENTLILHIAGSLHSGNAGRTLDLLSRLITDEPHSLLVLALAQLRVADDAGWAALDAVADGARRSDRRVLCLPDDALDRRNGAETTRFG